MYSKIALGVILSVSGLFLLSTKLPNKNISKVEISPPIARQTEAGIPSRIQIPAIKVDAEVDAVGLTADGAMGIPVGPSTADWFDQGPRPGQIGSAVIDGHFGWKDGIPAVFDNLSQLQKGDKIYIEDENGSTTTFVVQTQKILSDNASAISVFTAVDTGAHLNLITCEGVWNATTQSYSGRLVIFADKA